MSVLVFCRAIALFFVFSQTCFSAFSPISPATVCSSSECLALASLRIATGSTLSVYDCFPLHTACKDNNIGEITRLLDGVRIAPNAPDDLGNIPLHYAVLNRNSAAVRLLLEHSATPDADRIHRNRSGKAPYNMLLEVPIKRTEGATTRKEQYRALYTTLAYLLTLDLGQVEKIVSSAKCALRGSIRWGGRFPARFDGGPHITPFYRLVLDGNSEAVEQGLHLRTFVVDEMKDGRYQARCDERGWTPLMVLVCGSVATENDKRMAMCLLDASCDKAKFLGFVDQDGFAALHCAALVDNRDAVTFLLEAGAQPFVTTIDEDGNPFTSSFEMAFVGHSWGAVRAFITYFRAHEIVYDREGYRPLDILFNSRTNDSYANLDPVTIMKILQLYCNKRMAVI